MNCFERGITMHLEEDTKFRGATSFTVKSDKLVGKGRPRFTRAGRTYTPTQTAQYEQLIRQAYLQAGGAEYDCPVTVLICAYSPIPKSESKAMRKQMQDGQLVPCVKPDLDNIVKIVLDALNGVAYKDDALVCGISAHRDSYYDVGHALLSVLITPCRRRTNDRY